MGDNVPFSESDEGEVNSDFEDDFQEELKDYPHVLKLIQRLRDKVKKQKKKISKLRNKLNEEKSKRLMKTKTLIDYGTQTDPLSYEKNTHTAQDWKTNETETTVSITDQVKEAAESALLQNGFVYEETSGLYYDYNTGYYYDAKQRLYYDGNSGTYYYYDETTGTYQFHSQAQVIVNKAASHIMDKKERKARKANKVSDEINELISGLSDISIQRYKQQALDLAKTYPPCMRIIVKETNLSKIKEGSLFVVACTGGSIGREGDHAVLIPDINISKQHARIVYNDEKKHYEIIDLGSRNGTFLNNKRLSVAKQESEPHEVTHGSVIHVGGTKLLCHVHNGNETCGHCEPGLLQKNPNTEESKISKKDHHKQELRRLKTKFGVEKDNATAASQLACGYQDRAQSRRQCVGSSNHHVKTQQSCLDTSIAKDNRGFKMLAKMGWSEGQALGKEGDGRTEPVPLVSHHNKAGLGAAQQFPSMEVDTNTERKQALWRKTQKRYKEIAKQLD